MLQRNHLQTPPPVEVIQFPTPLPDPRPTEALGPFEAIPTPLPPGPTPSQISAINNKEGLRRGVPSPETCLLLLFMAFLGIILATAQAQALGSVPPPALLVGLAGIVLVLGAAALTLTAFTEIKGLSRPLLAGSTMLLSGGALISLGFSDRSTGQILADLVCAAGWAGILYAVWRYVTRMRTEARQSEQQLRKLRKRLARVRRAERALAASEARQHALLGAIPDILLFMYKDGFLTRIAPARDPYIHEDTPQDSDVVAFRTWPFESDPNLERGISMALERGGAQLFELPIKREANPIELEVRVIPGAEGEALVLLRDITSRRHLEQEILDVSAREQRRIARDLHDGLGQDLTGVLCLHRGLAKKLENGASPLAEEASDVSRLLKDAIARTKGLAKGLRPVELDALGFETALQDLAVTTETVFGIPCDFSYDKSVAVKDDATAEHLYRIAQEAVANAVKHAEPSQIQVHVTMDANKGVLTVTDDGIGIETTEGKSKGLGLGIMKYRARIIHATLRIRPGDAGGTVVSCSFSPMKPRLGGQNV